MRKHLSNKELKRPMLLKPLLLHLHLHPKKALILIPKCLSLISLPSLTHLISTHSWRDHWRKYTLSLRLSKLKKERKALKTCRRSRLSSRLFALRKRRPLEATQRETHRLIQNWLSKRPSSSIAKPKSLRSHLLSKKLFRRNLLQKFWKRALLKRKIQFQIQFFKN